MTALTRHDAALAHVAELLAEAAGHVHPSSLPPLTIDATEAAHLLRIVKAAIELDAPGLSILRSTWRRLMLDEAVQAYVLELARQRGAGTAP